MVESAYLGDGRLSHFSEVILAPVHLLLLPKFSNAERDQDSSPKDLSCIVIII